MRYDFTLVISSFYCYSAIILSPFCVHNDFNILVQLSVSIVLSIIEMPGRKSWIPGYRYLYHLDPKKSLKVKLCPFDQKSASDIPKWHFENDKHRPKQVDSFVSGRVGDPYRRPGDSVSIWKTPICIMWKNRHRCISMVRCVQNSVLLFSLSCQSYYEIISLKCL